MKLGSGPRSRLLAAAAALLLPACAADLAHEAATGVPAFTYVESITAASQARIDPDGPVRVCLSTLGKFHPWYQGWQFERPERAQVFLNVALLESSGAPVVIHQDDFKYMANRKCECSGGTPWKWKALDVELVGAAGAPAWEQRLVLRDGDRIVGTVELAPLERGHPLAWPLVPVGGVIDVTAVAVGFALYAPFALTFIWIPNGIYRLSTGHSPVADPDPCEISPGGALDPEAATSAARCVRRADDREAERLE